MTEMIFTDVPEGHLDRMLDLGHLAFHENPGERELAHRREMLRECERIGAYDGDELVGTLASFPFTVSVPGGELACPGVTFVAVSPTHRRRGVLSGMMAEFFRRTDGPLAALWASEASIYGRFGFGEGSQAVELEIDSVRPLGLRIAPDERPPRLVAPADAPALLAPFYEARRRERAGRIARTERWWRDMPLKAEVEGDEGMSPPRVVVLGEPLAGYAIYRTRSGPGEVHVQELEADSPAVAAALWRYLASIDLTRKVLAWGRPLDDPLLTFAADRDQVRVTSYQPAQWLRLVDVRAALEARSWAAPLDVVLEVRDERLPANAGRHRLHADGGGRCPRTDAPADLTLDVRDLAAAYLGGTPVRRLVAAGLAVEHTPGTAAALDAALATDALPHATDDY